MYLKKISLIMGFFLLSVHMFSDNLYSEYKKAVSLYMEKEYEKSDFVIDKVLEEFPEYDWAILLGMKINYELGNKSKSDFYYTALEGSVDDIKNELLSFYMEKDELERAEKVYDSLVRKTNMKTNFFEYLYQKKEYKKLLKKYSSEDYLKKIEDNKIEADKLYFMALNQIKSNEMDKALKNLNFAIEKYPENGVYLLKLGQVYADNKNFYLAEETLKKSVKYLADDKPYIDLFDIYVSMQRYSEAYDISKQILHVKKVRNTLRELYKNQKLVDRNINVSKIDGKRIYISRKEIDNSQIGSTFFIYDKKEIIRDNITGEILAELKGKVARVRVANVFENIVELYIIEQFGELKLDKNYFLI